MFENETEDDKKSSSKPAIAGALCGAITRFLCQPLDVIKIRFQLQVEPIHTGSPISKYTSLPQAVGSMLREEGIKVLWRGHVPGQALSIIYGSVQFWTYDQLNHLSQPLRSFLWPSVIDFSSGTLAGSAAIILSSPLDVIRTRLVAQDSTRGYRNMVQGFKEILALEGPKGLFRGCWTSIIQIGPQTGTQFMFYKMFKRFYSQMTGTEERQFPVLATISAGALSGFTSKIVVYPLDLAKKRLQIQEFHMHRYYNILLSTFHYLE